MFIKVLAVFGCVALASAADLSVGEGGKIIFEQNVTASPAIWKQVQNLTVNVTDSDEVISRVVVIDNRPEKNGEVKVVEGGEGHKNVTIELQSPAVFRGFDFSVQVFAAPETSFSAPGHPKSTGFDIQSPQVPYVKDITQGPKKETNEEIILGAPATSTTEAAKVNNHKHNQDKINPAVFGIDNEQTRLNRDTENQKTNEQPIGTAADLPSTNDHTKEPKDVQKSVQAEQNLGDHTKDLQESVQAEQDHDKVIESIFGNKSVKSIGEDQAQAVIPNISEEQQKTADKGHIVPALNKDSNGYDKQTTIKNEFSSTTPKNIEEPKAVSVTGEGPTTFADKSTTEASKLPGNVKTTHQLEHNIKGHVQHHHVPLPYVNQ